MEQSELLRLMLDECYALQKKCTTFEKENFLLINKLKETKKSEESISKDFIDKVHVIDILASVLLSNNEKLDCIKDMDQDNKSLIFNTIKQRLKNE